MAAPEAVACAAGAVAAARAEARCGDTRERERKSETPAVQGDFGLQGARNLVQAEATAQRISDILTGKDSPEAGLDKLALDIQKLLGDKAKLRYPVHGAL